MNQYRYPLYLLRWGILAIPGTWFLKLIQWLTPWLGLYEAMIIAQVTTGAWVYFIDKLIFKSPVFVPLWEIQQEIKCVDCGKLAKGFRLVKTKNYDKTQDKNPQFRCEKCSKIKMKELKKKGVKF